jgi:predicted dinucleotide-binding enzyme
MTDTRPELAVLEGTGSERKGLALRWAHTGYPVVIGSRSAEKASTAIASLNARLGRESVRGMDSGR